MGRKSLRFPSFQSPFSLFSYDQPGALIAAPNYDVDDSNDAVCDYLMLFDAAHSKQIECLRSFLHIPIIQPVLANSTD
jgi:hypothetical protein